MAKQAAKSLLDAIDPNASSDDENDQDFTLPEDRPSKRRKSRPDDHISLDEAENKKTELNEEEVIIEKRLKAERQWKEFLEVEEQSKRERLASSSSSGVAHRQGEQSVQITRPRNFAGKIIYETVTLPASHPDVEKYNRTIEPVTIISTNAPENFDRKDPSEISMPKEDIDRSRLHDDRPGLSKPQPNNKPPPGKRKRKGPTLESMNAELARPTAKQMSTFEKSQRDWNELTSNSTTLSTDLEANRRGGGFLEKQDFLGRVAGRRDEDVRGVGQGRRAK